MNLRANVAEKFGSEDYFDMIVTNAGTLPNDTKEYGCHICHNLACEQSAGKHMKVLFVAVVRALTFLFVA